MVDTPAVAVSDLIDRLRKVFLDWGLQEPVNQALHGWRCTYPDRYPEPCGHFEEFMADVATVFSEAPPARRAEDGHEALQAVLDAADAYLDPQNQYTESRLHALIEAVHEARRVRAARLSASDGATEGA